MDRCVFESLIFVIYLNNILKLANVVGSPRATRGGTSCAHLKAACKFKGKTAFKPTTYNVMKNK